MWKSSPVSGQQQFFSTNRIFSKTLQLFLFISALFSFSYAQNGWDLIMKNEFVSAKEAFKNQLEKDSVNKNALEGLLFLTETTGDDLSSKKYARSYMRHYGDDNFFFLFRDELGMKADEIINSGKLSYRAKADAWMIKADKEFYNRNFSQSKKITEKYFNKLNWSLIGPFSNIEGSGHVVKYGPESDKYNAKAVYKNEDGLSLSWVEPPYSNTECGIAFNDHLATEKNSTYYATTFFQSSQNAEIFLRLTRTDQIKVWLDGSLVYNADYTVTNEWDIESVKLKIKKGTHRILVKVSSLPENSRYGSSNSSAAAEDVNYNDDYSSVMESYGSRRKHKGDFLLRITDQEGNPLQFISAAAATEVATHNYTADAESLSVIRMWKQKAEQAPQDLFSLYMLAKAYLHYQQSQLGEEFFVKFYRNNKQSIFAQYLVYKIYLENYKKEKAYETLRGVDYSKTPVFQLLHEKLLEVDKKNEEEKYLSLLDSLNKISPSNLKVINKYIDHYDRKGQQEKKEDYVKSVIKKYPEYTATLKHHLKKDLSEKKKDDEEDFRSEQNDSYKKTIKKHKSGLERHFDKFDYNQLIEHYTMKHDEKEVVQLYDDLISVEPWETNHYYRKANFYFGEEKFDKAIETLDAASKINPYDQAIYQLAGDAYYEKKEKEKALEYYKKAKAITYYRQTLESKIEKITGPKQYKKLFKTPGFREILADTSWKEKYANEESVVLMYTKDLVIDADKRMEIYQRFAVKILSDAGIKKWLEYDFSFLGRIKMARVLKTNGAEIIPEGSGGYKVFKNLEVGDIILLEGQSTGEAASTQFPNDFYTYTYFSYEGPVNYAKYEVAVPEGRYLGYRHHKLKNTLVKSTHDNFDFYKWEYRDLPKTMNEDAIIDKMDKWANILISTMPDWTTIVNWYQQKTYKKLEPTYEVKEILDSIITPKMTDKQKVETIYNYLTKNIKYSYVSFLQSGYIPKDPGQTVCSRIGDCKDVATLMISMLRQVGIESYYVLVKTNDYFHQDILPCNYFNHAIAGYYIDGKLHFADMTTDYYPYYILPTMDAGACGLLIKEGTKELLHLPKDNIDSVKNKAEVDITATLNSDRSLSLKVRSKMKGALGGNLREHITQIGEEEKKNKVLQMMGNGIFSNLNIENYNFGNVDDISNPLEGNFDFNAYNFCDRVSNMLVFRVPYMISINSHPAIYSNKRFNQLDVRDIAEVEGNVQKVTVIFPEAYDLMEMPKDFSLESKYGSYKVNFKKVAGGLLVTKTQVFYMSIIPIEEFTEFKQYYETILDFDSSKFALVKKKK